MSRAEQNSLFTICIDKLTISNICKLALLNGRSGLAVGT